MLLEPPTSFTLSQDGSTVTVENDSRYATSWNWDYGNGHTTDERHPEPYIYPEPGTYTLTLTTENYCCTNSYSIEVEVEGTVGTEELAVRPFSVHPNPAADYLTLESHNGAEMIYSLLEAGGREIYGGIFRDATTVDLTELPSGILLCAGLYRR